MWTRFCVVVVAIAGAVVAVSTLAGGASTHRSALGCPAGYTHESDSGRACVALQHPEKPIELILREAGARSPRSAPYVGVSPDAYASALAQRQALVANRPQLK